MTSAPRSRSRDCDGLPADRPIRRRARQLFAVPGPAWVAPAVRTAGVLAALGPVGGWLGWGWVGAALMALVLLGVTIVRVLRLPGTLQLLVDLSLAAAGWAALLELYQRVWWLDLLAHAVATGLLSVVGTVAWLRTRPPGVPPPGRPGLAAVTLAAGLALALAWELVEWAGHTFLEPAIFVSYDDSLGDLAAGGCGSAAAGAWHAARSDPWTSRGAS